jgi:hypothetical protein
MMGWWVVLLFIVVGVLAFLRIYRRRLSALKGPWIADELSPND